MQLQDIIIENIKKHGPISFRDFMETCLYHPDYGYYTSSKEKIGKKGDYYTGSSVSPVFGEMMGKQIEEIWHLLGEKEFTVVEMGAGTGSLSGDVLEYLRTNDELYKCLDYRIIEKSPALRDEQKERLGRDVKWHDSLEELSGITGCMFSNELVDAFPVHVVEMKEELMEVFVDHDDGFFEVLRPASPELKGYLEELDVVLPSGYRTEINLDAIKWIKDVSKCLEKGYLITIDYGYPAAELYQEYRNRGTLMCYYKHTASDDPYVNIGEQDITSHVNFSALDHIGKKNGLELLGFTDQAHFLLGLGIEDHLKKIQGSGDHLKKMLQVKTLFMGMGETFKVLVQGKGILNQELSGLKSRSSWNI